MTRTPAVTATLWGGGGMLAGAGLLGLTVGAVAMYRALRRIHAERPGWTEGVFVPVAVLLMLVSGGPAALLAPAACRRAGPARGRTCRPSYRRCGLGPAAGLITCWCATTRRRARIGS